MGWPRKANWNLKRKHQNQWNKAEAFYHVKSDRLGNTKIENWEVVWTTSRSTSRWAKRRTNKQYRAASKRIVNYELYLDDLHMEDMGKKFDFLGNDISDYEYPDDDPMDYWDYYEEFEEPLDDREWFNDPYEYVEWYEDYY